MDFEDNKDLFDRLPTESRAKIQRLCDASEMARAASLDAWDRVQEARQNLAHVRGVTENQKAAASHTFRSAMGGSFDGLARRVPEPEQPPSRRALTDPDIERLDQQVADAQARLERALAAQEVANAKLDEFSFLADAVAWLKTYLTNGGRLAHQPLPDAKLVRGETHRQAVERVRDQIAACDERWSEIEVAPLPADELKTRIVAEVDALAADGRPKIRRQDFGAGVSGVKEALFLRKAGGLYVSDVASPLFCWLHRDSLIERLHAEVDSMHLEGAMTDDARDEAFSHLLDQKLALAFEEEAFVVAAEQEGITASRRREADPRAVLQVCEVFADEFSVERNGDQRPARRRAPAHTEATL